MQSCKYLAALSFLLPWCFLLGQETSSAVSPDTLLVAARKQAALKEYPASILSYQQYLESRFSDNDVRNELARTFAWNGQYDSALTQYDVVLERDSKNFDARYGRCQTLAWRGNLQQALSESDTLVLRNRGNIDALLLAAQLHARSRDFAGSLEKNRQVLTEDPDNVQAMIGACVALEVLGRSDEAYAEIGKFRQRVTKNNEVEAMYDRLSPKPLNQVFLRFQNESFDAGGRSDFRTVEAQGYRELQNDLTVFVQLDLYRRFDQIDQSVGAGAYYAPASRQSLYGYVLVSPDPKVTRGVDASLEYEYGFATSSSAILDYRLMTFKSETVHILSPGFVWRPTSAFELRPRVFISRTVMARATSYAFLVRASYEGWDDVVPYVFYSVGTEAYRGITLDNIEASHSWSLTGGAKLVATSHIIVRVNYQYLNRIGKFRESSFDVGLGYLW